MSDYRDVDEYLAGREEMRRRELVWGVVREPPAPRFGHQAVVGRTFALLDQHIRAHALGIVCISPADVVLDAEKALVVQPDVFFIGHERLAIIRDQVWGAPDLVVEVASPATAHYDRVTKMEWYRTYGVREAWLIDPHAASVTVVDCVVCDDDGRTFTGSARVESHVLQAFDASAERFFE